MHISDFGHSNEAQCLQVITLFSAIDEPDVRDKVVELIKALANTTGQLNHER